MLVIEDEEYANKLPKDIERELTRAMYNPSQYMSNSPNLSEDDVIDIFRNFQLLSDLVQVAKPDGTVQAATTSLTQASSIEYKT